MDDQGLDPRNPRSAPPATSEPASASQPLPPWQIPQPAPPTGPGQSAVPGAEPPAPSPYGGPPTTPPDAPTSPGTYPSQPAGAAPYPSYPAYPSAPYPYPTSPGATTPGAPSLPLTPGAAPGYPGYPPAPGQPAYPGLPSMPLAPGAPYPETPATPYYPIASAPYPYAGPPSQHSMVVLGAAPATIPLVPQGPLGRPFPLWLTALIAVGSLALLVVAFLGGSLAAGQDWAGSALVAGIAAALLALGAIALLLVRVARGRRAGSAIALGVVGIVLLASIGLGGVAGAAPIHALQAGSLEGSGSWSAAIHEYALSGEHAPNAPNIARVYDEWGESLLKQGTYSAALGRFNTVVTTYAQSGTAALDRANRGLFDTYGRWITANTPDVPYINAIAFVEQYAQSGACDASCHATGATYAAQGRFQYGEQLLAQNNYLEATVQFDAVQSKYPTSSFAPQAHAEGAKAYLALGKQQIGGENCATDAVATYQTLAQHYGDTPQGKEAQGALKAPVTVSGHISGPYPHSPTPTGVLSKHIDPNNFYLSSEYTTGIDAGSGKFSFHNVQQGTYNFSTVAYLSSETDYVYWYGDNHNYYFVQVGPLCTVQLDNLDPYPSSFS